jgi:hypothetical protein
MGMMENHPARFGADDVADPLLALRQIVFLVLVTLIEHKWVTSAERRSTKGWATA